MSYIHRQPILNEKTEAKLKKELSELWSKGLTANEIAEKLEFGKLGGPYEKLKVYHVYFYRSKFGLPPRRVRPKGKPRYKDKKEDVMPFNVFKETLNRKIPKKGFFNRRKRTYLILHYWTPLRKSEIYERSIEDFTLKDGFLKIDLLRKKKQYPKTVKSEPIEVLLALPLMNEVIEWLTKEEWKSPENKENRPWNISGQTAWKYVKEVFAEHYPHFFRFNYITDGFEDPQTTLVEMKTKTGLHVVTLNTYLMKSKRKRMALDERKLAKVKLEE